MKLALIFTAVLLAGCRPSGPAALPPSRHVVEISGMAFHPAHLQVAAGDTVVWINKDIVPHTATAAASTWDTGTIASQDSSKLIVKAGADSSYACALHPTMEATLVVR